MEDIEFLLFFIFTLVIGFVAWSWISKNGQNINKSLTESVSKLSKKPTGSAFQTIGDHFTSLEQIQNGLRDAGLESCNLILGIDFTKSNEYTGKKTFGEKSLHSLDPNQQNPYQQVISILGRTLEVFDEDKLISAFGFGDTTTKGNKVFPFFPNRPGNGFQEILEQYNRLCPVIQLSGPTNFAPLIYEAINIVRSAKDYHILLIVADGNVTSEKETIEAIVEASNHPMSIVMIGVGDGPWDMMNEFDDSLPQRKFDNFQFVPFHKIISGTANPEPAFALACLMEIPEQLKEIKRLKLL